MGSCMTKNSKSLLVLSCQNVQFAVAVKNCTEVYNLSVYFSCTCCACQSFADVISDVNYGFCFGIFFFGSVFQCDNHSFELLLCLNKSVSFFHRDELTSDSFDK